MSPEGILWCKAYEMRGGVIAIIECGLSSLALQRRADSAKAWMTRHGLRHIAPELRPLVAAGHLSLAAARLPAVWNALAELGGWQSVRQMQAVLGLRHESIIATLGVLVLRGRAEVTAVAQVRAVKSGERHDTLVYRALGSRAPDLSELPRAA